MPKPAKGEKKEDYIKRCIPIVIREGTAKDGAQGSAICHSMWEQHLKEHTLEIHSIQTDQYAVRAEMHQGRKHLIVPVVMMVEGVHNGSHGPMLHPAEELGKFPQAWNGIPVTVQHPSVEGQSVSANQPQVIDSVTVGRVYNAHMDGNKLRAEAWIDESRIAQVSPQALSYIRGQRNLEVSVGVFSEEDDISGTWNNEAYIGIARNHRPDHLALLPGGQGACSWADGCGVRTNEEGIIDNFEPPEAGNAPAGVKGILSKVYNSCRSAWVKDHPNDRENTANKTSCSKIAWDAVRQAGWRKNDDQWVKTHEKGGGNTEIYEVIKKLSAKGFTVLQINEQGYRDLIQKLQAELDAKDNDSKVHFLQEVYRDSLIYEVRKRETGESSLFRQTYEVGDDGIIMLTGSPNGVTRKVEYVNANSSAADADITGGISKMADEKKTPCCPKKVELLIQSEHTPFKDADKGVLEVLEEAFIDKLLAMENLLSKEPEKADPPQIDKDQAIQVLRESLSSPEQFIALLPSELQDSMRSGLKLHSEKRAQLIATVMANSKAFTDDKLKDKTVQELEDLVSLIPAKVDYSINAGGGSVSKQQEILLPPGVEIKKSA